MAILIDVDGRRLADMLILLDLLVISEFDSTEGGLLWILLGIEHEFLVQFEHVISVIIDVKQHHMHLVFPWIAFDLLDESTEVGYVHDSALIGLLLLSGLLTRRNPL